ncbi:hypothetical protein JHK85_016856 [Glycine max]|nr:hypothetical protein JHK85_016856 [Glycine max]
MIFSTISVTLFFAAINIAKTLLSMYKETSVVSSLVCFCVSSVPWKECSTEVSSILEGLLELLENKECAHWKAKYPDIHGLGARVSTKGSNAKSPSQFEQNSISIFGIQDSTLLQNSYGWDTYTIVE